MFQDAFVSIITPSYNSAKYIEETMNSVIQQTYQSWEMIIVDDGSSDDSQQIIRNYTAQDERIKLIVNEENIGASKSRNKAIDVAIGEYIAFLDSDDIWYENKLEKQIALMQEKDVLLSYSAYETIDEQSKVTGMFPVQEKITYDNLLKTSSIGTLTAVYNAQVLGKIYFKDIGHEDYVMKLHILKKIDYAQGITEPLAKYRIHNNSLSNNKLKAAKWQWKIYRDVEKISFVRSLYYFLHYAYFGFFKYSLSKDKHMKMIRVRFHRRETNRKFSYDREEYFPYRIDQYREYIPGTYAIIFTCQKDSYNSNNKS